MHHNHLSRCFFFLCALSVLMSSLIEGKGFGFGRGGSSRRSGIFGGSSSHNRGSSYGGYISKPHSRSSFKQNAMSFAAGAAGGAAAYSIMRSLTRSHHSRPGVSYGPGYGDGATCVNHENMDGVVFGQFRCPLHGFPFQARYCCGEYGKQYCCSREASPQYPSNWHTQ